MPTIEQDILAIQQGTFGRDIRDALADAISDLNDRVSALEQNQNQNQTQTQDQ